MSKNIEIIVTPDTIEEIRDEFNRFIEFANNKKLLELEVYFGFAWRGFPSENSEFLTPDELRARVIEEEKLTDRKLGENDIFITPKNFDVEFTFCHETDIHLEGPPDSKFIQDEKVRYKSLGWKIYERIIDKTE